MCYTVGQDKTVDKINLGKAKPIKLSAMKKAETMPVAFYISGFGSPNLLVITAESPNEIDVMKWGLVPSFISDSVKAKEYADNTLNAKSETIFEKVSFKNSIMQQRCLVLVSGFFEWRSEGGIKYPYYIKLKDQDIISFGGDLFKLGK
jgi:putative SOS response-associated peptidase YedK